MVPDENLSAMIDKLRGSLPFVENGSIAIFDKY
jgi:hypothetical protein